MSALVNAKTAWRTPSRDTISKCSRVWGIAGHDEEHEVDPAHAGKHVLDEALVAGHVHHSDLDAAGEVEMGKAQVNRYAALFLFPEAIGVDAGERLDERGLAVVDVAGGAYDHAPHAATRARVRFGLRGR
jgi:hypothetical protein